MRAVFKEEAEKKKRRSRSGERYGQEDSGYKPGLDFDEGGSVR
jgi:hypothetical protein